MRSYGASRWQLFFKVRIYSALPYLFPSLKVGTAVSLLGALISETETSNAKGLGFAILGQVQAGNVADLWVLFLIAAGMGIFFVSTVGWLEKFVAPWMRQI
jgi:NitT/TauT family transport system permease protein